MCFCKSKKKWLLTNKTNQELSDVTAICTSSCHLENDTDKWFLWINLTPILWRLYLAVAPPFSMADHWMWIQLFIKFCTHIEREEQKSCMQNVLKDGGALGQQILFVKTYFFLLVTKACLADQKILPSSQCVLTFHYHPMN